MSTAGRIYDNIEDKNEVVVLDIRKHAVAATWPIAAGEEASGLPIDTAHHRLFLGCGNKMMVMMDSQGGKVLGNVPIGDHVDANAFDPKTRLAFSSNRDGTLTVARETTGRSWRPSRRSRPRLARRAWRSIRCYPETQRDDSGTTVRSSGA